MSRDKEKGGRSVRFNAFARHRPAEGVDMTEDVYDLIRRRTMMEITIFLIIGVPTFSFLLFGYFYIITVAPFPTASLVFISVLSLLLYHMINSFPLQMKRYRKSGNFYHFSSLFSGLNFLALAYIPYSVRLFLPGMPTSNELLFFFILPMGLFLLVDIILMILLFTSKLKGEFHGPYTFTTFLPRHLDIGLRDTNTFKDGYSDRPKSIGIEVPQPKRFTEFAKLLMGHLVILDYVEEGDGRLKLFLFPMNIIDKFRVMFTRNDSYLVIDPPNGQATVHLASKDYEAILAPVSYHLLCENIVMRIMRSYEFFLAGEKEEAMNVFRQSWKDLDAIEDGRNRLEFNKDVGGKLEKDMSTEG